YPVFYSQRIHEHVAVLAKLHEVEAAECSSVLVLLAALQSGFHALDHESRVCQFVVAEREIEPFHIGRQHGYYERGRRAEAGTRRHIDARTHAQAEWFAAIEASDNVVVDGLEQIEVAIVLKHSLRGVGNALVLVGRDKLDGVGLQRFEGRVSIIVDSRVENRAAEFIAIRRNVCAATGQSKT